MTFLEGAALGCRYMTAFHGVVDRARVSAGEWVAVHGCGGVGLSVVQIATAQEMEAGGSLEALFLDLTQRSEGQG